MAPATPLPPVVTRTHPRYDEWLSVWRTLGHLYEGDGPFLTGEALVPHVRELLYQQRSDETYDFTNPTGFKIKYVHRQKLARYENFASVIIDTLSDHQYVKEVNRRAKPSSPALDHHPIADWWDDVDGYGLSMDDWLQHFQPLANVYGHIVVVMDRMGDPLTATKKVKGIRTQLDQRNARPVLRAYTPPDVPDWLTTRNNYLTAVKLTEPVLRTSLTELALPAMLNYLIVDDRYITRYDPYGKLVSQVPHGFGQLPVVVFYGRRRARIPVIGRSLLRDPKVFVDHYNLVSELREIFRSQTFSMLNIQLGDKETVTEARNRLGDHAGTDALVFTKGPATFIAPPAGPAEQYALEIANVERKIYRISGLPWQNDSKDRESEGALKIKLQDLNRTLAKNADEAERFEYLAATLWFSAEVGVSKAQAAMEQAEVTINHPDEFNTENLQAALTDALTAMTVGLGPTADTLIKGNLVPLLLKNLPNDDEQKIQDEIRVRVQQDETQRVAMDKQALQPAPAPGAGFAGKPA